MVDMIVFQFIQIQIFMMEILQQILSVPEASGSEENPEHGEEKADERHPNEAINHPLYPPRVFFSDLNADSLNLLVYYWYRPPDYWAYQEHASGVNLQIIERFNAAGIAFAFPTQTVHLAHDDQPAKVDAADSDGAASIHVTRDG